MSESIFEHTTSIAGLTCKPLSILSETISPEEMSKARGGDGMGGPGGGPQPGQDPREAEAERKSWKEAAKKAGEDQESKDKPGLGPLGGTYWPIINVAGNPNEETFWTDTTAQADSSGTQDQNGGALDDEIDEEDDWNPDGEDDDDLSNNFETLWEFETAEPDNTRANSSGG